MAVRDIQGEGSGLDPNAWMVTFSDLLTLMLTFFVLLLTMSSMDNQRLRETFGFFAGTQGGLEMEERGASGGAPAAHDMRYPEMYVLPPGALRAEAFQEMRMAWGANESPTEQPDRQSTYEIERELTETLQDLDLNRGVEIRRDGRQLIVGFSEGVLFELGEVRINDHGLMVLEKCGDILATIPNHVRVEGHTDDLPVLGGRYRTNWELSTTRAVNVLRYFTESLGLDNKRFSAVGYGEYKPLVPNTSPENRAKNRRAEVVILSAYKSL